MGFIVTVVSDFTQIAARPVLPRLSDGTTSISVIGLGYVGAVSCGCLSALGHTVVGVDLDPRKRGSDRSGPLAHPSKPTSTISSPPASPTASSSVTSDTEAAILDTDVTFVSVGTPSRKRRQL